MKNLVYIGFAFKHHEKTYAGYHHIRENVNYDYIIDVQKYFDAFSKSGKNKNRNTLKWIFWFVIKKILRYEYILRCIILGIIHDNLTFHFIYGENIYVDFSKYIRKGNTIVCTLHQPIEWFSTPIWLKRLQSMDKIILVSEKELIDFKLITGRDNVYYIPHGISDFYRINQNVKKEHILLSVGNWLRDYEFANKVYKELLKRDANLNIVVVANAKCLNKITKDNRIHLMQGITDNELLNLYQKCSVLFLPLIRFTANNALLEAAATGCNIVISTNHSDNCYVPKEYIVQTPMIVENAVVAIEMSCNKSPNQELSQYIKEKYSWPIIAKQIEKLLKP